MNIDLSTIDNYIKKSNEIIDVNKKCFKELLKKLKKIQILKAKIESFNDSHNSELIKITEKLSEKEKQLNDEIQKIKEISATDELTIDEIISEITIINNLLNNNFITDFLISIKTIEKNKLPEYNLIIDKTIQLKEYLKDPEKTEEYLFETTIYKYMIKLINNYHHICIKIQNKNLKDSIVQIYEINKIIEKEEEKNIIEQFNNITPFKTEVNKKYFRTVVHKEFDPEIKQNFEVYYNYKQLITEIKELFKNIDKTDQELKKIEKINLLISNTKNKRTYPNYDNSILNDQYNMIFDYFNYIKNIIINKIKHKKLEIEKENIIEELKIKKEVLFLELEEAISKNKEDILEKILQIKNNSLSQIIQSDDLEYKITNTNKIINYFNKEYNKNKSDDNNNCLQLFKKLLKIYIQEQKLKLKDFLKEINEHYQKLKKILFVPQKYNDDSTNNQDEYRYLYYLYLEFNNNVIININDINNNFNNIFYYDYENNFKQILIKDYLYLEDTTDKTDNIIGLDIDNIMKKLEENILSISNLEDNIIYYQLDIDKILYYQYLINEKSRSNNNKYISEITIIQEKQNIILDLIFKIKLIMKNIKENSLNKILKNNLNIIQNKKTNDTTHNELLDKIEKYFIFDPKIEQFTSIDKNNIITIIEQFTLIDKLTNLLTYVGEKFYSINTIIKYMIKKENEYNKENVELLNDYNNYNYNNKFLINNNNNNKYKSLLDRYNDIKLKNKEYTLLKDEIINLYNFNNLSTKYKSFYFNSNLIKNIKQIIKYLNDNDNDKNFINIIKIYNIISKKVKIESYKDRGYNLDNMKEIDYFNTFYSINKELKLFFPKYILPLTDNVYNSITELQIEIFNSITKYKDVININSKINNILNLINSISKILLDDNKDKITEHFKQEEEKLNNIKIEISKIEYKCETYNWSREPIDNIFSCFIINKINILTKLIDSYNVDVQQYYKLLV
jgi:hypothetical protein